MVLQTNIGPPIRCDCRFEIIHASDILDDGVTGTIPNIHAKREVGLHLHGALPTVWLAGRMLPQMRT
jgi:hypothetical protein